MPKPENSEAQQCANTNRASIENNRVGNIDMNIVAKADLNFHGMNLIPVESVPGIWLTSTDVAKALGYKSTKSITNLFNQNADEFSDGMTQVIESVTSGNYRKKVRVFSLRGAHLIAMFARTDVAKEFRRWVLDILDREVAINMPVIDEPSIREKHAYNANALAKHYAVMYEAWKNQIYPALRAIESPLATRLCDRFKDGAIFMMYVQKGAEKQLEKGEIARI
ncbi:BRO-N domain-containing protein [Citrobacter freundii]|uniref:BRO-N domain-containing protein n=1 Tax=Citrobacter freundii TaxID=546 RepID=UPI0027F85E9E|nr:Bro-N domain-containing protein [Salmonella enterica subsp. enterica serovar Typhimurium]ELA2338055.1 Bro-N domain-containing protein [Salmonella enterica]HCC4463023.1 Bro-N domain-containing protein [Citrobacter freundii]HCT0162909.1 Bro-N domain-containing protein [Salmonella enterica subsp. enterica serovar Saintpaul]HCT1610833.1 Bro-N domain-containing protein [Salmonella enterica subsp. enterica serovar Saintpaul]